MFNILQTLLRASIVLCILLVVLGSNLGILSGFDALGYIAALTTTLMLSYA